MYYLVENSEGYHITTNNNKQDEGFSKLIARRLVTSSEAVSLSPDDVNIWIIIYYTMQIFALV
jgi:hypothetical protein